MGHIDLHVHSNYSNDGEYGVQDLIVKCLNNKVEILSVTDHNSVSAVSDALTPALNAGITLIPGIEVDCSFNGIDLHVLGYNIDWNSNDFKVLEDSIHKKVMDAFPLMIENLAKLGIYVNGNEVLEKGGGQLPCGELIAEVLLNNKDYHTNKILLPYMSGGERSDMPYINFYHDFFAQGKPAYVPINYMDFQEAIELVKSNGGIPIIAHPGMNLRGKEEIVYDLLDNGAEGLEIFNNYHETSQIQFFADIAIRKKILMTGGSDFHGKNKPLINIGKFRMIDNYEDYFLKSTDQIIDSIPSSF
ncbi:MAG: PHP domain-containing protein [Bacteroidales bacterium]